MNPTFVRKIHHMSENTISKKTEGKLGDGYYINYACDKSVVEVKWPEMCSGSCVRVGAAGVC